MAGFRRPLTQADGESEAEHSCAVVLSPAANLDGDLWRFTHSDSQSVGRVRFAHRVWTWMLAIGPLLAIAIVSQRTPLWESRYFRFAHVEYHENSSAETGVIPVSGAGFH